MYIWELMGVTEKFAFQMWKNNIDLLGFMRELLRGGIFTVIFFRKYAPSPFYGKNEGGGQNYGNDCTWDVYTVQYTSLSAITLIGLLTQDSCTCMNKKLLDMYEKYRLS